ncbi:MAG TPA: response regulator transcription factor [Anaerolineales bacterium]|nr:response regulator transcription factor [Anaerolineales bacterium]
MIKVLIADDHAVVRQGLKQILGETSDMQVVGEATTGPEALEKARAEGWDVMILDLTLPGRSGFEILKALRAEKPDQPVLILSMHAEDQFAVRLLKAGASGYLTKESVPEELIKAIRKVVAGGKYVSPALAERLAFEMDAASERLPHEALSDREFQVMQMIATGKAVKQIAEELSLSVKTVSTYRARILEKMNLKTNADLIHYAIQQRLIE